MHFKGMMLFALCCLAPMSHAEALNLNEAKQVTIQDTSITVKEALEQVKLQSGICLLYQESVIDKKIRLNLDLSNAKFTEAMDLICQKAGLAYEVTDKHVIITKAETKQNDAKHRTISGVVLDAADCHSSEPVFAP